MQEIWKDIPNTNSIYQVSNLGNVRSKYNKYSHKVEENYKLLKPFKNKKGYLMVDIKELGKTIPVHRLVAEVFIPNPENKPQVNHKRGNKKDNRASELEWVTNAENMEHACNTGLIKKGVDRHNSIKVEQYDLNGNYIKTWGCISDVKRELKIDTSHIGEVCRGTRKTAGGYKWKYVNKG